MTVTEIRPIHVGMTDRSPRRACGGGAAGGAGDPCLLVSSDDAENWQEVEEYHGDLQASGYTLDRATDESRKAFCDTLGVGVRESHRVAHGLFALKDGVFLAAEVPDDQMETPDIHAFLEAVHRALDALGR